MNIPARRGGRPNLLDLCSSFGVSSSCSPRTFFLSSSRSSVLSPDGLFLPGRLSRLEDGRPNGRGRLGLSSSPLGLFCPLDGLFCPLLGLFCPSDGLPCPIFGRFCPPLGLFCPKLGRGRLLGGINLDLSVVDSPELVSVGLGLRVAAVGTSRAASVLVVGFSTSASSCLSGEKSCLKDAVSVVLRVGRGVVRGLGLVEGRAGLGRVEGDGGGGRDPSLELELDTRVSTLTSRTPSSSKFTN